MTSGFSEIALWLLLVRIESTAEGAASLSGWGVLLLPFVFPAASSLLFCADPSGVVMEVSADVPTFPLFFVPAPATAVVVVVPVIFAIQLLPRSHCDCRENTGAPMDIEIF